MKRKLLIILIIISILFEGVFIYHLFTPINNKELEEVNIKNLSSDDKSIAIMVQNEDDSWEEATDRSKWPSKEDYGYMGAECTDSEGTAIPSDNILKFDLMTYHATIDTKNSIYCTLYFAKGRPLLQVLEDNKGSSLNLSAAVDGMYRYKGTTSVVNNNYICFGTVDKNECTKTSPDKYMYRIIGITSEERTENNGQNIMWKKDQLKIIKAIPSNELQIWYTDYSSAKEWDLTDVKRYLNETFYDNIKDVKQNGTYWDSIITTHSWYNVVYSSVPNAEPTTLLTEYSKIGLMYATDYKNSGDENANNWLHIKNGLSSISNTYTNTNEWTMSRSGFYLGGYCPWDIHPDGTLYRDYVNGPYAVRPVFYLQPQINLTGTGKADDPFRIRSMNNVS